MKMVNGCVTMKCVQNHRLADVLVGFYDPPEKLGAAAGDKGGHILLGSAARKAGQGKKSRGKDGRNL